MAAMKFMMLLLLAVVALVGFAQAEEGLTRKLLNSKGYAVPVHYAKKVEIVEPTPVVKKVAKVPVATPAPVPVIKKVIKVPVPTPAPATPAPVIKKIVKVPAPTSAPKKVVKVVRVPSKKVYQLEVPTPAPVVPTPEVPISGARHL